jgi:hypothetical protein
MAILSRLPRSYSLALLLGLCLVGAAEPSAPPTADAVKAAFLCSFAEFVEWPAEKPGQTPAAERPVTVGVLGDDPFGSLLEETAKARGGRPIAIVRFRSLEEVAGVQILFVSASERGALQRIVDRVGRSHVLTVSDITGFAREGGIIGFFVEEKRVQFEINVAAAEVAGVRISSRLLNLARIVDRPRGGSSG